MPKRSRIRGATLAAALLLGSSSLASCSDNPAPEPLASDTPSATATATATPSPTGAPALPPEARGTTRKSAVAFVRHWVDTLNYSADTLDTKHLRELSAPNCDGCTTAVEIIEDLRRDGGRFIEHEWTLQEMQPLTVDSTTAQVQVLVKSAASRVVEKAGQEPKDYKPGKTVYVFTLEDRASQWTVRQIRGTVQ